MELWTPPSAAVLICPLRFSGAPRALPLSWTPHRVAVSHVPCLWRCVSCMHNSLRSKNIGAPSHCFWDIGLFSTWPGLNVQNVHMFCLANCPFLCRMTCTRASAPRVLYTVSLAPDCDESAYALLPYFCHDHLSTLCHAVGLAARFPSAVISLYRNARNLCVVLGREEQEILQTHKFI